MTQKKHFYQHWFFTVIFWPLLVGIIILMIQHFFFRNDGKVGPNISRNISHSNAGGGYSLPKDFKGNFEDNIAYNNEGPGVELRDQNNQ